MEIIYDEKQSKFDFSVIGLVLGFLLLIMGLVFGNEPMVKPNVREHRDKVWNNRVSPEQVAQWIEKGRASFLLVGCCDIEGTKSKGRIKGAHVFSKEKVLNNIRWVRSRFPNINVPMVVYGKDQESSLDAATCLSFYGYDVRMMEGGFNAFKQKFMTPVDIPDNVSAEKRKQLELRQARYRYFSGKDDNLGEKKELKVGGPKIKKRKVQITVEGC